MSDLRVDKNRLPVTLLLVTGESLAGTLYVAPDVLPTSGSQGVLELLGEGGAVLPFQTDDGQFLLAGTSSIAAVRCRGRIAQPPELVTRVAARAELQGGHRVEGVLVGERGAGSRASDLFKTDELWIPLEQGADLVWLAKARLVTVEPLQSA